MRNGMRPASSIGGVGNIRLHAGSVIELNTQEPTMIRLDISRATLLGALLSATAGSALADNAAPTTTTQPTQQQTGVTAPAPQPTVTTSIPASTPKAKPSNPYKRAERGESSHRRGMSH
jgi:hypothetical protein